MDSMQRSGIKKYSRVDINTYDDAPTELHETEVDRQVKGLLQKQLATRISLKEQLMNRKEFVSTSNFIPVTELVSGPVTLSDFQAAEETAATIQYYKSCGLSDEEMQLKFAQIEGGESFRKKCAKVDTAALEARLKSIDEQVDRKTGELRRKHDIHEGLSLNRHELELELSLRPSGEKALLLHFLITQKQNKPDSRPAGHPINQLKQLEKDLLRRVELKTPPVQSTAKITRCNHNCKVEEKARFGTSTFVGPSRPDSLWDVKTPVPTFILSRKRSENVIANDTSQGQKKTKLFTIENSEIVPLDSTCKSEGITASIRSGKSIPFVAPRSPSEEIPSDHVAMNRLCVEDIRKLPKFANYDPGRPSKVLYIKNLAKSVNEMDLVDLFGSCDAKGKSLLQYRLLNGRMKGQAFVTFPDMEEAAAALNRVNGCQLKGKPVIVEFGKS